MAKYRPRLDTLEARTVPTCTITQNGPTLTILGTDQQDIVQITDDGSSVVQVQCDGDLLPRVFNGVSAIELNTLKGRDLVRYDLRGTVFNARSLSVDLGAGADTFLGFFNQNDLFFGANFRWLVQGKAGADVISVDATRGVDIGQGATLGLRLLGGLGLDQIDFAYDGGLNGTLSVVGDGGLRRDVVAINIDAAANAGGRVFARCLGGLGNDDLTLNVTQPPGVCIVPPCGLTVDAVINGGPGIDSCTATFNVLRRNCP